jgi:hypothetical protein
MESWTFLGTHGISQEAAQCGSETIQVAPNLYHLGACAKELFQSGWPGSQSSIPTDPKQGFLPQYMFLLFLLLRVEL